MRLVPICAVMSLTVFGISCGGGLGTGQVITWLDAKTAAPDLEVGGSWDSVKPFIAGGWGNGVWSQKDGKVTGSLGLYSLEGRVAGRKVYLALTIQGKIYFTAVLEATKDGGLTGMAVAKALADEPGRLQDTVPMELMRPVAQQ